MLTHEHENLTLARFRELDRSRVRMHPLADRRNRQDIERDHVDPDQSPGSLDASAQALVCELSERVQSARQHDRPVVLAFGAHSIKNGLGPVLIRLIEGGWVTHLATNGAGIIHDWEFAYQGATSECVQSNVLTGRFGNWQETGFYINLAINLGAANGLGYGESVGRLIEHGGLRVPTTEELRLSIPELAASEPERAAAAADLLHKLDEFSTPAGWMPVEHPWSAYSVQAAAHRLKVPLTGHPMIGHDIIYNHPMNHCAAIGRAAQRDFLRFADAISRISGGVYLSVGSAVMSPMVFEKSFSMAQNLAGQNGQRIDDHYIFVNDIAENDWDWSVGEPPEDHPAYYQRYNKTFCRMGGSLRYLAADNRDLLTNLLHALPGSV